MIWTVYGDESGTHDPSPIITMGGFLSTADLWEQFEFQWAILLQDYKLEYLHAVDFVHRNSPFKCWSAERMNTFVLRVQSLIDTYLSAGFVVVLRKDDYKKHYKSGHKPKKLPQDTQYWPAPGLDDTHLS